MKYGRAGDVVAVGGGQEGGQARDVGRLAEAGEWNLAHQRLELLGVVQQRRVDGRLDGARGDVVDGDAERPELDGERPRQHPQAALAGAVGGKVGERQVLVDRADVDHLAAVPGGAAVLHERLRAEEHALQVHVHHAVVVLLGDVPEGRVVFDAGVVHQDVEASQRVDALRHQCAHGVDRCGVALKHRALAPRREDVAKGLLGALRIAVVVDHHIGALLRQPKRDATADALAAAGDERLAAKKACGHL